MKYWDGGFETGTRTKGKLLLAGFPYSWLLVFCTGFFGLESAYISIESNLLFLYPPGLSSDQGRHLEPEYLASFIGLKVGAFPDETEFQPLTDWEADPEAAAAWLRE